MRRCEWRPRFTEDVLAQAVLARRRLYGVLTAQPAAPAVGRVTAAGDRRVTAAGNHRITLS